MRSATAKSASTARMQPPLRCFDSYPRLAAVFERDPSLEQKADCETRRSVTHGD